MVLENKSYVPTLAVRASEMNGLEFLPAATKDQMSPCFLLAPWANTKTIDRTITRIERAFPNRKYFLDIDRDYEFTNLENDTQIELAQLLNPVDNYRNWIQFVSEHENIMPCIQSRGQSTADIREQILAYQEIERPFCMRVVRDRFPNNFGEIVDALVAGGTADYAIILEGGWTRDPLSLAVWFAGIIAGGLNTIDASVPVIVSCTSIPKLFTPISDAHPVIIPFNNRQLFEEIVRGANRTSVIYGDWGSTRPREPGGFANRPLDRVDYPTEKAWHIARNKEDDWDFRDAAKATVGSSAWRGDLGIWGEEMIQNTTINEDLGINTPQKNVATRVNIHLHQQAFNGNPPIGPLVFDEDWID